MNTLKNIASRVTRALDARNVAVVRVIDLTGEVLPPPRSLNTHARASTWAPPCGTPADITFPRAHAESSKKFAVVRHRDGKAWAGPWVKNGATFTSVPSRWYVFASEEAAQVAVDREEFTFRVDVLEF